MFSKKSTAFEAALADVIFFRSETLRHMCRKLKRFDKILLVTPDAYKRSALVLTVEILFVLCVTGVIHAIEIQDRHLGSIKTLAVFGWILVSCTNNTAILQFLNWSEL